MTGNKRIKKISFTMPFHISEQGGGAGGAEVQAWLLAKELARRGYEVAYICTSVNNKAGEEENVEGVLIKWVKNVRYFRWLSLPGYYSAVKDFDPDLVVERGSSFQSGAAAFYCNKYRRTYVWICTDDMSPRKWMNMTRQASLNRSSSINVIKKSALLLDAFISDLIRHWAMRRITCPFTQSQWQHDVLLTEFGIQSDRMISGHEPPAIMTSASEKLSAGIVLWVANLGPRKRPEEFIAMAMKAKDSNYRFIMIGGRKDPDYLRKIFKNLPDNIECLGRLSFEETLQWFDKAAFFVNTSTLKGEGFPNTFIQAWLHCVPTFSLQVNPDDVITKNRLGSVGNAGYLMDQINKLSGDPEEYSALSDRVYRYASKNHSVGVMTDRFIKTVEKR